jgi:hypothetical protein
MNQERIFEDIQKNSRRFREQVEEVRADGMRSAEGKKTDLEEIYKTHSAKHSELERRYRDDLDKRLERSREGAFAFPRVSKDPAIDLLVRRDAIDRAGRTIDSAGLSMVLESAKTLGDSVLAKAVLHRAYEFGSAEVVNQYLEAFPEEREPYQAFVATAEEFNVLEQSGLSAIAGAFAPEKPIEIGGEPLRESSTARGGSQLERDLAAASVPVAVHEVDDS